MPEIDSGLHLAILDQARALESLSQREARLWLGRGNYALGGVSPAILAARRVVDGAKVYWWQDPGITLELATAGLGVDSPESEALASARMGQVATATNVEEVVGEQGPQLNTRADVNELLGLDRIYFHGIDPAEPTLDSVGRFAGYEALHPSQNARLISAVDQMVDQGVSQEEILAAFANGSLDPYEVEKAVRESEREFSRFTLTRLSDLERSPDVTDWNMGREQAYSMLAALPPDIRASLPDDVSRDEVRMLIDHEIEVGTIADYWAEDVVSARHLERNAWEEEATERLYTAAIARGEIEPPPEGRAVEIETPEEEGGGNPWWRSALGEVTQPFVAIADVGRQVNVNRFRQNLDALGMGVENLYAQGRMGASGGQIFQEPTLVNQFTPITPTGQAGLETAGAYGEVFQDVLTYAGAMAGVRGVGLRSMAARFGMGIAIPELSESLTSVLSGGPILTDDQTARYRATDLAVMFERPELRGDGLLFSSDFTLERQRRERELVNNLLPNGEMLTWGRTFAITLGTDPGTDPYNVLSGAVDFADALFGPGELIGDTAVAGYRNLRRLPVVRTIPFLGHADPLFNAGGISGRWRNMVMRPSVNEWLDSWRGQGVARQLAEMSDVDEVYRAFKGNIPVGDAAYLARASNPDDVTAFLRASMGARIRDAPQLAWSGRLRHSTSITARLTDHFSTLRRVTADMPDREALSLFDPEETYRWSRDFMSNEGFDAARRNELLNELANASSTPDRYVVVVDKIMKEAREMTYASIYSRASRPTRILQTAFGAPGDVSDEVWDAIDDYYAWVDAPDDVRRAVGVDTLPELTRGQDLAYKFREVRAGRMDIGDLPYRERRAYELQNHLDGLENEARKRSEELVRMIRDREHSSTVYNIDATGHNVPSILTPFGDYDTVLPEPHAVTEMIHSRLPVPQMNQLREMRRINSTFYDTIGYIFASGAPNSAGKLRWPAALVSRATDMWKYAAITRPAYIMRVVGEEQVRIAAYGGDSLVNNPMGWAAYVAASRMGRDDNGLLLRWLDDHTNVSGLNRSIPGGDLNRLSGDALLSGDPLRDYTYQAAHIRAHQRQWALARDWIKVGKGDVPATRYAQYYAEELGAVAYDPIYQTVAKHGVEGAADVTESDPKLMRFLREVKDGHPDAVMDVETRAGLIAYLEEAEGRIENLTSYITDDGMLIKSDDLRAAIADGKITDEAGNVILIRDNADLALHNTTPEMVEYLLRDRGAGLGTLADEFGPDFIRGVRARFDQGHIKDSQVAFRAFLDYMGGRILTQPSDVASRGPVFLQEYWSAVADNWRHMSPGTARKLLDEGIPDSLPRDLRRTIRHRLDQAAAENTGRGMNADAYDLYAQAVAIDATNDLLFNMATKQQWADFVRTAFPFAQAWAEIIETWGRMAVRNPTIMRRINQANTVLRDEDFASGLGQVLPWWEPIDGVGIIYTDDYGSQRIQVPWAAGGARRLAEAYNATVAKLPLTPELNIPEGFLEGGVAYGIPVESLNVGTTVIPGVGPAISWAAARWMPERIMYKEVPGTGMSLTQIVHPFGEPRTDILEIPYNVAPSWVRYGLGMTGPGGFASRQDIATHDGRIAAAKRYLMVNYPERYQPFSYANTEQLLDDAKRLVERSAVSSWLGAFFGPGPVQPEYFTLDDNGRVLPNPVDHPEAANELLTVLTLSNIHRVALDQMVNEGLSYDDALAIADATAIEAADGNWGAIFSTLSKSRGQYWINPPMTERAYTWYLDNPEMSREARYTWPMFAPQDEGEFFQPMLALTYDLDFRQGYTPDDINVLVANISGDYLYREAENLALEVWPDGNFPDEIDAQLAEHAQRVLTQIPGWPDDDPVQRRGGMPQIIEELDRVTGEGGYFADHPFAPWIQDIITTRAEIDQAMRDLELTTAKLTWPAASSAQGEVFRNIYNRHLEAAVEAEPEMATIVEFVFRAEMRAGLEKDELREEAG